MGKVLEKSLKDARKEGGLTMGARQVLGSVAGSKLVVLSRSAGDAADAIRAGAREAGVPTVDYGGTSVALGRLCGIQFRVSAVSFRSLAESAVQSVIKDAGSK